MICSEEDSWLLYHDEAPKPLWEECSAKEPSRPLSHSSFLSVCHSTKLILLRDLRCSDAREHPLYVPLVVFVKTLLQILEKGVRGAYRIRIDQVSSAPSGIAFEILRLEGLHPNIHPSGLRGELKDLRRWCSWIAELALVLDRAFSIHPQLQLNDVSKTLEALEKGWGT